MQIRPKPVYTEEYFRTHAAEIVRMTYSEMKEKLGIPLGSANEVRRKCFKYLQMTPNSLTRGPKPGNAPRGKSESRKDREREAQAKYYEKRKFAKLADIEGTDYRDGYELLLEERAINRSKLPPVTNYCSISLLKPKK